MAVKNKSSQSGSALIEVILSSAVFGLLVLALTSAWLYGQETGGINGNRARAVYLAEEGLEAARNIRDAGFANLTAGAYGLSTSSNQWNLSGSSDNIILVSTTFTRQLNIATAPDGKHKAVTSTVSWTESAQRNGSVAVATNFTYWQEIISLIGDWSNPTREAGLDLSGSVAGAKIQVSGNYVYLIRNSGVNFYVIDISIPASPVVVGSLSLNGNLTDIILSGDYAYVSSQDNSREVQIVNIATPSAPVMVGSYNASGNTDMLGIYAVGTIIYAVRGSSSQPELYIINATNPVVPTLLGSLELGAAGNKVFVSGSYAYIASAHNSQELQIANIVNPAAPSLVGSLNLSGNQDALSITGFASTIALGRADSLLHLIDVSNPALPASLGSFNASGDINSISLGNDNSYAFLAVSAQDAEFQVVDISTPSAPVLFGSTNLSGNVPLNGLVYHAELDRVFAAGSANSEEFTVIAPQ